MRKLCVALLLFMLAFPLLGQVTLLDEDFEPTPDPLWNFYLDLGSAGWSHETASATYYHSADHVIRQLYGGSGVVTTSWAVYGPLTVPGANPLISWWEYSSWPGDYDYHGVWVSTSNPAVSGTGVFTEVEEVSDVSAALTNKTVDLSGAISSGSTVWIAFKYAEEFGTSWYIDDVLIQCDEPLYGYIAGNVNRVGEADNGGVNVEVIGTGASDVSLSPSGDYVIESYIGTYDMRAYLATYYPDSAFDVVVVEDETTWVDFEVSIAPFGTIEGYADLTDTPGADAGITVYTNTGLTTTTDASGYYSFPDILNGDYVVFGDYTGYHTNSTPLFTLMPSDSFMADSIFLDPSLSSTPAFCEDFDADDGGLEADPATGAWAWGTPNYIYGPSAAHSSPYCWGTVLDDDYASGAAWHLYYDLPYVGSRVGGVSFWHWYDIEDYWDGGNVYFSTDDGASWFLAHPDGGYDSDCYATGDSVFSGDNDFGGEAAFKATWIAEGFTVPDGMEITNIRFSFWSDGSFAYAGWYIDDICLYTETPGPKGSVSGIVYSTGSWEPIEGALVVGPGGITTYSDVDGYYELEDVPVGIHTITSHKTGYFPGEEQAAVYEGGDVNVWIPMSPVAHTGGSGFEVDIAYDHPETTETVITICNPTDQEVDYYFGNEALEMIGGSLFREAKSLKFTEMPATPAEDSYARVLPSKIPERSASSVKRELATGDLFTSWPVTGGIDLAWGIGIHSLYETEKIWITDISDYETFIREYTANGVYTGRYFDPIAMWPTIAWIGDMVSDGTGMWLLQVGGSNRLYKLDVETFAIIDSLIDPTPGTGWGSISQRGVAYDPVEDVFYIGGWNSGAIWKVKGKSWDEPGAEVDAGISAPSCAGLGFHPGRRTLWYADNLAGLIHEVDYETGTLLNTITPPPSDPALAGLEIDGTGRIFYVSMDDNSVYIMDSGYGVLPGGIYFEPSWGTLGPGECVDITVITSGHQAKPGEYVIDAHLITDPTVDPIQIPVTINVCPTIDRGWNIVSVPVMAVPDDPWAQLHDDIDPFDASGASSQLYAWDPILGRYVVPSSFERGRGYYLWGWYNDTKFDVFGEAYTSDYTQTLTYYTEADMPGWQVIGNPFNKRVDWSNVTDDPAFSGIDETAWFFSTTRGWSTYTPGLPPMGATNEIDPYVGWWVKLHSPTATIPFKYEYTYESFAKAASEITVTDKIKDKSVKNSKATDFALDSIILRISAESRLGSDVRVDYWNYLGTKAEAIDALPLDAYDHVEMASTPPGYSPLNASFVQGTNLLKDEFKSRFLDNESKTWSFRVSGLTSGTLVIISWPIDAPTDPADGSQGTSEIPEYYNLTAVHPVTGEEIDMRTEDEIAFIYSSPVTIEFTVSSLILDVDEENAIPDVYSLSQNRPNPFNATTELTFGLPENTDVTLEVFNIMGQKVSTLISGEEKTAGYHKVVWDGMTDKNTKVPSGVYFYRVSTPAFEDTKKMILVK